MAKLVSRSRSKIILIMFCFFSLPLYFPALAGDPGFDKAKASYRNKSYNEAIRQLENLLARGDSRPIVHLYLAHSLYMVGRKEKANQVYEKIARDFAGTPEAEMASSALKKFFYAGKIKQSEKVSQRRESLIDRITVIPPRFGHPRVSENTVSIVRGTLSRLPERLYSILEEGGAKLYIASNMLDRWPDSMNAKHPADGHLYCNEPGRTYDLDMYVFERPLATEGFKDLGQVWSEKVIRESTYMQCAHALDYLLEHLSSDAEFKKFYDQDLKAMSRDLKEKLPIFAANTRNARIETFGEIMMGEMGFDSQYGSLMKQAFPRTRMFVKDTIRRVKLKK